MKDIQQNKEQEGSSASLSPPVGGAQVALHTAVVSDSGAIGPAPAAQLVTPGHAQLLPWQPLHCARRPQVTTADTPPADLSSSPLLSTPLTQHRRPRIPATRLAKSNPGSD